LFAVGERGLGEIGVGILHEVRLDLLVAEAIGLALNGCIDRAISLHVFAVGKAPATLVIELTGDGRRGEAEQEDPAPADVMYVLTIVLLLGVGCYPRSTLHPGVPAFMCDISCIG